MIKKHLIVLIILVMAQIAVSCVNSSTVDEELPNIDIPAQELNTIIQLIDSPELANSYKNGDLLTLQIKNLSGDTIIFSENFDIEVITKIQEQWADVQNSFYNAGENHYLPTSNSYPLGLIITALPYIPELSSPTTIRVIVVGRMQSNNKQVGAYVDIKLIP